MERDLSKFKLVGFFDERDLIIRHIRDFFEIANKHQIRACIMFGTLLGKLRHDDFIPWDDDVDIVIFDFDAFLEHVAPELEERRYVVALDIRDGKRMGCRIFHQDNTEVPGRPRLRFPWIGIWEHEVGDDGLILLPPEDIRYEPEDFLPLAHADFLGASVGIPASPVGSMAVGRGVDSGLRDLLLRRRRERPNSGHSSRLGDFLDTLTDRVTELLLVAAIAFSLGERVDTATSLAAGFALLGGVFVLTTSSEKFRSTYRMGYPKRQLERFLGLVCAGSDSRLLMLSIGLVVSELTGHGSVLLWLIWVLAAATYVNFGIRIRLVQRHFGGEDPLSSRRHEP